MENFYKVSLILLLSSTCLANSVDVDLVDSVAYNQAGYESQVNGYINKQSKYLVKKYNLHYPVLIYGLYRAKRIQIPFKNKKLILTPTQIMLELNL